MGTLPSFRVALGSSHCTFMTHDGSHGSFDTTVSQVVLHGQTTTFIKSIMPWTKKVVWLQSHDCNCHVFNGQLLVFYKYILCCYCTQSTNCSGFAKTFLAK